MGRTSTFALALAAFGAHIAQGHFLASSHVLSLEGPEDKESPQITDQHSGDVPEKQDGKPDKSMVKSGEKFEPIFEHAKKGKEGEEVKPKYPVIFAIHQSLSKVFAKYTDSWYGDWKLWLGLTFWFAVWTKWLIHGYTEVYHERALHAFGVNIVILHILQYASTVLGGMLCVCAMLVAQTLFGSWWWYAADAATHELDVFDCDTLYLDLALPCEQIVILFIAQFGVWWFYMTSILGNFDFSSVNYLFWVWAYLVMQMTMIFNRGDDSVLGNPFPLHDVQRIMMNTDKAAFCLLDEDEEETGEKFRIRKANIIMRGITGFFCNAILRDIMAYTIPLMLMGFSEPMDFVVYCVGVNFICTLDDMSERKYTMTPLKDAADAEEVKIDQD